MNCLAVHMNFQIWMKEFSVTDNYRLKICFVREGLVMKILTYNDWITLDFYMQVVCNMFAACAKLLRASLIFTMKELVRKKVVNDVIPCLTSHFPYP